MCLNFNAIHLFMPHLSVDDVLSIAGSLMIVRLAPHPHAPAPPLTRSAGARLHALHRSLGQRQWQGAHRVPCMYESLQRNLMYLLSKIPNPAPNPKPKALNVLQLSGVGFLLAAANLATVHSPPNGAACRMCDLTSPSATQ